MKSSASFNPTRNLSIILQGAPGTGKTTTGLQFPRPAIIDFDNNLAGPRRYLGQSKEFGYETVALEEKNGVVKQRPLANQFMHGMAELQKACESPDYDTIIVSSMTTLCTALEQYLLSRKDPGDKNKDKLTLPDYGDVKRILTSFIMKFANCGKIAILECHETYDLNETGAIQELRPAIMGELKHTAGAFFTDVWRTYLSHKSSAETKNMIRTRASNQLKLKCSLALPPEFEMKWETIKAAIDAPIKQ